jgi:hypothetical protein
MRPGTPLSMRSAYFSTTPPLVASTSAGSRVSAPVAGLVLITVTLRPTYFSSSFCGVSRSKSKFCSIRRRLPPPSARRLAVSGRILALTSRRAMLLAPRSKGMRRTSLISASESL